MADVHTESHVKSQYRKVILKFAPDTNGDIKDPEKCYLMDRIMNVINDAWKEFSKK